MVELGAAAVCGLLALLAAVHFATERGAWRKMDRFANDFQFEKRWPDHVKTARLEPSADLGALVLADAAVMEEAGGVKWPELDEAAREAWFASLETREAELKSALDLMLDAAASRPGWHLPYHFAGKLSYLAERRRGANSPLDRDPPWALALQTGARAAPGYDGTPVFLGAAWLETWGRLSPSLRKEAEPVLKRALLDTDFVLEALPALAGAISVGGAAALLPDQPGSLRAARDMIAAWGDAREAKTLNDRWVEAERTSRRSDLAALEKKAAHGDTDGLRGMCPEFARKHPVHELDDAEGRLQAARLLDLWPSDGAGRWLSDPRGPVVRYFLDGREASVSGTALMRAVDGMSGVPDVVRARARLAGGEPATAEEVAGSSASTGAFEWTSYLVARGWSLVKEGQPEKVEGVLKRIPGTARNECDVLLLRREVDRKAGEALADVRRVPPAMTERGSLFPCLDPDQDRDRFLRLDLASAAPVLVTWGWNGGTEGSVVVEGRQSIRIPLAGWRGRALLSLRPVAGKLPTVFTASFDPPIPDVGVR
jgi:hypothetical protein